jgi:hypothetical protein
MPTDDPKDASSEAVRRGRRKWLIGVATAVLIGVLTAISIGLWDRAVDAISAEDPPALVSYGAELQGTECGVGTFLPEPQAAATVAERPPYELDEWKRFRYRPDAVFANSDLLQVSIQGESLREITLTGIEFSVTRQKRPEGATFGAACGDALRGRGIQVDLEADPPQIVSSSKTQEGIVTASPLESSETFPISFPWTVSVTDPLLLYILATARFCDCTWSAEIPWVSGSEKGVIQIDNGGAGYRVVGAEGLAAYTSGGESWQRQAD